MHDEQFQNNEPDAALSFRLYLDHLDQVYGCTSDRSNSKNTKVIPSQGSSKTPTKKTQDGNSQPLNRLRLKLEQLHGSLPKCPESRETAAELLQCVVEQNEGIASVHGNMHQLVLKALTIFEQRSHEQQGDSEDYVTGIKAIRETARKLGDSLQSSLELSNRRLRLIKDLSWTHH